MKFTAYKEEVKRVGEVLDSIEAKNVRKMF